MPKDSAANGIVDPRMFKPDPEVARKARDELVQLKTRTRGGRRFAGTAPHPQAHS